MSSTHDHGGNVFSIARQLGVSSSGLVDFSASINPLGLSPLVKEAIIGALDSLVHYPDNSRRELKQALSSYHGVSPANIVVANGSTEIIYHLPAMLTGCRALIVSPAFSEYVHALDQHHWEAHHFILSPESNFALDTVALERVLAEGYDALYLCNPGNPSGRLYPLQIIERILSLCTASGTFLVLDEAFMDFCEDASAKHLIVERDNGVVLRSMTKFFGIPGLRLGYAIADGKLAARLEAMGGPWSVNTMALVAGETALQDKEYSRRTIEFIRQERRNLFDKLSRFPMLEPYPSEANFLLVEITNGLTAMELREQLICQGMIIRDCSNFMGLSANFFRIAVRTREENGRLIECLKRVLK